MNPRWISALFVVLIAHAGLSQPAGAPNRLPAAPDYANMDHWAASPFKADNADRTPTDTLRDQQSTAPADVFFLHPTIYTGKRGSSPWNGAIDDAKLNKKVDESTILYQASIFNGAGRVFAPRYRQAHLSAYTLKDKDLQRDIFDVAYQDVRAAFEYYLQHYNEGRPIIIASHSQGTTHAKRLLRDLVEGRALQAQLVVAYLVGIAVEADYFQTLQPCETPDDTGCFVSWRAWRRGHSPTYHIKNNNIIVTNPLTWTRTTDPASRDLNRGAVLRKFNKVLPAVAEAQIHDGLLWLDRPNFPGSFFLRNPNYHIGDFNLYYMNVRLNAMHRVQVFLEGADGKNRAGNN